MDEEATGQGTQLGPGMAESSPRASRRNAALPTSGF